MHIESTGGYWSTTELFECQLHSSLDAHLKIDGCASRSDVVLHGVVC